MTYSELKDLNGDIWISQCGEGLIRAVFYSNSNPNDPNPPMALSQYSFEHAFLSLISQLTNNENLQNRLKEEYAKKIPPGIMHRFEYTIDRVLFSLSPCSAFRIFVTNRHVEVEHQFMRNSMRHKPGVKSNFAKAKTVEEAIYNVLKIGNFHGE